MLRHLLQGTLAYTGMDVLEPFVGWHIPYVSEDQRRLVLEEWRTRLQSVRGEEALLRFPSLSEYDERLYPRRSQELVSGLT
jgi:NAD(P)H dehydrogenase (quinone)